MTRCRFSWVPLKTQVSDARFIYNITLFRSYFPRWFFVTLIPRFTISEWYVAILDHVLKTEEEIVTEEIWEKIIAVTLICLFIVMQKSVIKYMTKMGQKTGILKQSKNVHINPIMVLFVTAYQNLNSGSLRTNGRNSSFALKGSSGPFSSAANRCIQRSTLFPPNRYSPSKSIAGSIFGVKNAINKFRW